jgi:hypothetical protein
MTEIVTKAGFYNGQWRRAGERAPDPNDGDVPVRPLAGSAGQEDLGAGPETVSPAVGDAPSHAAPGETDPDAGAEDDGGDAHEPVGDDDDGEGGQSLDDMTKDELLAEAKRRDVDVDSGARKAEILKALKAAESEG